MPSCPPGVLGTRPHTSQACNSWDRSQRYLSLPFPSGDEAHCLTASGSQLLPPPLGPHPARNDAKVSCVTQNRSRGKVDKGGGGVGELLEEVTRSRGKSETGSGLSREGPTQSVLGEEERVQRPWGRNQLGSFAGHTGPEQWSWVSCGSYSKCVGSQGTTCRDSARGRPSWRQGGSLSRG